MRSSLIVALLCTGSAAHAFDDASQFFVNQALPHAASVSASAEGVYFTGAPRWSSLDCTSCHTDGPGRIGIKVGADDPTLFTVGYAPGRTYQLDVSLLDEVEGLQYNTPTCTEPQAGSYVQCNNNNFAMEIDDEARTPRGTLCAARPLSAGCPAADPSGDEVLVSPDGQAVFGNRQHPPGMPKIASRNDPTHWNLWWTAPPAGTGPVTIYLAAVDGNGGDGTAASDQDPAGDDTVSATISLQEQNAEVPTGAMASCALGRSDPAMALPLTILVGSALLFRRRRRSL